jgi:hypothetical protein
MKPIPDKAEIALEFPDKRYSGTFERSSHFDAHMDERGIALSFSRGRADAERRSVRMHLRYALFAEILNELGKTVSAIAAADAPQRAALASAASAFAAALQLGEKAAPAAEEGDLGDLTPEEEVTLLHILE